MKQSFIKSFVLAGTFFTAFNVNASTSPNLLEVSEDPLVNVSSFLKAQDNASFKATCNMENNAVESHYELFLKESLNSFKEFSENAKEKIKKFDTNDISIEIENRINKDGYVFSTDSSLIAHLYKTHESLLLVDLLKGDVDFTKDLYKALFKKDLKEDAFDLCLKSLVAACPIDALYVEKDDQNVEEVYKNFKTTYGELLLKELHQKATSTNYFLWGIDTDASVLKEPHTIVVHQSQRAGFKGSVLAKDNSHTVIYNADQEVLEFDRPPSYLRKLVVTNVQKNCEKIQKRFLMRRKFIETVLFKRLEKVRSIESGFLNSIHFLESVSLEGLNGVNSIGDNFLCDHESLKSVSLEGLNEVTSIGDFFMLSFPFQNQAGQIEEDLLTHKAGVYTVKR